MAETVFYSWQSDLPNRCNRGFIARALEQAIAALTQDATLEVALRFDQDTADVPGSPDIGATILRKIDEASAFIADVSIVSGEAPRKTPNPNVLVELGYALKALGSERVIIVMNTHFGAPETLPFDLRLKRAIPYSASPDEDIQNERSRLRRRLESSLRLVFESVDEAALRQRLSEYASELAAEIVSFLLIAEQMEERYLNPWFREAQHSFRGLAGRCRDLAVPEEAEELGVADLLRQLGKRLDTVGAHVGAIGRENWQEYLGKVQNALSVGRELKMKVVDGLNWGTSSIAAARDQVASSRRRLVSLSREAQAEIAVGGYTHWKELRDKASEEGRKLLYLSYFPLPLAVTDGEELQKLGRELHQLEMLDQRTVGRETIDRCLHAIVDLAARVEDLTGEE